MPATNADLTLGHTKDLPATNADLTLGQTKDIPATTADFPLVQTKDVLTTKVTLRAGKRRGRGDTHHVDTQ
eukprot:59826-Amphidinium_carterae.1